MYSTCILKLPVELPKEWRLVILSKVIISLVSPLALNGRLAKICPQVSDSVRPLKVHMHTLSPAVV